MSRGPKATPPVLLPDGRWVVSRRTAAQLGHRHIDDVIEELSDPSKPFYCEVACFVKTRAVLLDLDVVERWNAQKNRRKPLPLGPE